MNTTELLEKFFQAYSETDQAIFGDFQNTFNEVADKFEKNPKLVYEDGPNARILQIILNFSTNENTLKKVCNTLISLFKSEEKPPIAAAYFDCIKNRAIGLYDFFPDKGPDECIKDLLPPLADFVNEFAKINPDKAFGMLGAVTASYFNSGRFDTNLSDKNMEEFIKKTEWIIKEAYSKKEDTTTEIDYLNLVVSKIGKQIGITAKS